MATAAVQIVRLVVATATVRGVPPGKLLASAGVDPQLVLDVDGRVPLEIALRVWRVASEMIGDPWFGLSAVEHLRPDSFGFLGFAIHSSPCVGDGLRRLSRYFQVVNQSASLKIIEDGAVVRVRFLADHDGPADELRHPVECLLTALLVIVRRTTGTPLTPVAVSFRHAAPADLAAYVRVFGVSPSFGRPFSELVLARDALDLPHLAPDGGLVALAERHLRRLLDELPRADTLASRVRRVLVQELRLGEPTLARVAACLRTSKRTLQRRLGQEGTSMQALLDGLRRGLSISHLAESKESIAEISFLLGFAEVRAFHRAFKRWTGSTPAAFRQARAAVAGEG